ncbi:MAG: DUF2752 domain-containing protein [Planctomycetota bacterium]
MHRSQQTNSPFFYRATSVQRLRGAIIFVVLGLIFVFLWLGGSGEIDTGRWFGPCGFKQRHNLPCPTCGMTTSATAFAHGRFFEAFYIQPAGGLLCSILALSAFLAFLVAVCGIYCRFLERFFSEVKLWYIILAVLVLITAGWAVTLARTIMSG